ncbi:MAG: glucosaminidase domain-containing protein [Oscillospiraceae bacterium]
MKDNFFAKLISNIIILAITLGICWGILCLCVCCGVRAFACEFDVTAPCGMSTEELEAVLKYDLKPYAEAFLNAEADYDINACFLASIAALESGWGRYMFRENNIFGFGKKDFESVENCIDYVAWFLRKNYLNETGRYYRGGTIEAIGSVYCPDGGEWVELVTSIYGGLCK